MKTKAEKEEQTRKEKERHEKRVGRDAGIYIVHSDNFPPPLF